MNEYEPTFCLTPRVGETEGAELVVAAGGSAAVVDVVALVEGEDVAGTVVDVDVGFDVLAVLDFDVETEDEVEAFELVVATVEILLVVEVVVHGGRLTSFL
jgi:hypothetical protein